MNRLQALARDICHNHGLEYLLSNVCGARFARAIHAIIYNREDADEAARADACCRELAKLFFDHGIFVDRAPTMYHEFHQAQRMPEFVRACESVKAALDLNGVIAPGKYSIE